jgi:CheY-like chemotaxis protein
LVVDDDDLVRETIAASLVHRGYTVLQAAHGREALDVLARTTSIDIIVLDILMPEMEGIETLRAIRKGWSMLPVLVVSGGDRSGWTDALGMASLLGANRTLRKPFTPRQLVETLDIALKEARRG